VDQASAAARLGVGAPEGTHALPLDYARRGLAVVPLHAPRDGGCTCGDTSCARRGKHPRVRDWSRLATTDPRTINRWWTATPNANVGLLTGGVGGLLVLDIDGDAGGEDALAALVAEHGPLAPAPEVQTGAGRHLYYRCPGGIGSRTRLGGHAGLDLRGAGGLVVAPGSRHANGSVYRWVPGRDLDAIEPPAPPPWLLELATTARTAPRRPRGRPTQRGRRAVSVRDTTSAIAAIKTTVDIVALAEDLGMAPTREGKIRCPSPSHPERTPSCHLHGDSQSYHCYGCGIHGSAIDLYMLVRGVDLATAVRELCRRYGIGRGTRREFLVRLVPSAVDSPPGLPARQARERLRDDLADWIPRGSGRVLLVAAQAGVGKSRTAAEVVCDLRRAGAIGTVVWALPRHDAFMDEALAPLREAGAVEVQPRSPSNCAQADKAAALQDRGYNVASTLCRSCQARATCGYYRQFETTVRCVQHRHLLVPHALAGADLVVVDESVLDGTLLDTVDLAADDLDELAGVAASPQERALLHELRALLQDLRAGRVEAAALAGPAIFDRLDGRLVGGLAATVRDALASRRRPRPTVDGLGLDELRLLPPNHASLLFEVLDHEVQRWTTCSAFNSRMWATRHERAPGVVGPARLRLFRRNRPACLDAPGHPPLVVLDATGDAALYGHVLGRPVEEWRVTVDPPDHVRLWLVRDVKDLGKWSLTYGRANRASAVAKLRYLLGRPEFGDARARRVGLVTHRRIAAEVADGIGADAVAHFGALRGSNLLARHDVLVVLGHNQEPPDELHRKAEGAYWDDERPIDPTATNTDGVYRHADARLARIAALTREHELEQAVSRVRPLTAERPTDIVVYSPLTPALAPRQPVRIATQFPSLRGARTFT